MMEIYEYSDFRVFIREWVQSRPRQGYGQYRKMAHFLRLAPVTISQILTGDRNLSPEAALPLADFFGLNSVERKFFLKLVLLAQAGTDALRSLIQEEIEKLRADAQSLKNRVPSQIEISAADLAIFHSSWIFSAIRMLTATEPVTIQSIATKLSLASHKVEAVLEFLVSRGLCKYENNQYKLGASRTHLPEDSPFIVSRQISWRSKAMERMHRQWPDEIYYTAPMIMSLDDIPKVRKEILQLIDRVNAIVIPSKSEELVCLNIDWFRVAPQS